jgi:hypothetical protein
VSKAGSFSNRKAGVTVLVNEGENPGYAMDYAKEFVKKSLDEDEAEDGKVEALKDAMRRMRQVMDEAEEKDIPF